MPLLRGPAANGIPYKVTGVIDGASVDGVVNVFQNGDFEHNFSPRVAVHFDDAIVCIFVILSPIRGVKMAWKAYECRVGLIRENDGSYSAYAINLPGVASQGETESEAIANIIDALTGAISEHLISGQIPWEDDHIEEQMVERRVFIRPQKWKQ